VPACLPACLPALSNGVSLSLRLASLMEASSAAGRRHCFAVGLSLPPVLLRRRIELGEEGDLLGEELCDGEGHGRCWNGTPSISVVASASSPSSDLTTSAEGWDDPNRS